MDRGPASGHGNTDAQNVHRLKVGGFRPGAHRINRAVEFAGGRLRAAPKGLGATYSVEFWFWNGLPVSVRPVTGYLLSRGADGSEAGDHLGIGGTSGGTGRLFFSNGAKPERILSGSTELETKSWHHAAPQVPPWAPTPRGLPRYGSLATLAGVSPYQGVRIPSPSPRRLSFRKRRSGA
jgi:hypothetical protein